MPKFQISPSQKHRKNDPKSSKHSATDTTVQRKLCPNFKFHPLKNLKNIFDIKSLNNAAADTAVQRKLCPKFKFHPLKNLVKV